MRHPDRVPLELGYLEVYRRSNVELVSVNDNQIECVTPDGLRLHDGMEYKFDVLIFATGFDAGTGALTRMDIHGRGGRSLTEEWGRDIRATMGPLLCRSTAGKNPIARTAASRSQRRPRSPPSTRSRKWRSQASRTSRPVMIRLAQTSLA